MPRRTRASNLNVSLATLPPPPQLDPYAENLSLLRRQWKWAAFSQFFCTFSQLFAMSDVTVSDIESDLVYQTNTVIPRIMQRLLYTLSYDRKVTLNNWQSALRKQYIKRDPLASPIGPEPKDDEPQAKVEDEVAEVPEAESTDVSIEEYDEKHLGEQNNTRRGRIPSIDTENSGLHSDESSVHSIRLSSGKHLRGSDTEDAAEERTKQKAPTDWFDLPMITKLESMHTLAEWQFQNATRLRTIMKSDDELASWRIEPLGYDSKSNAYWFIGGDRLWIQRVPPKPVKLRSLKRKRTADKSSDASPKTIPISKRPRLEPNIHASDQKNSMNDVPLSGRQSRAAKDQAKLKLDLQAKELAQLNHEAGILKRKVKPRQTSSKAQPSRRVIGTRTSARLRGTQDNEWQPIPDEWLEDETTARSGTGFAMARTGLESDRETVSDLTELSEEAEESRDPQPQLSSPANAAKDKGARHLGVDLHEEVQDTCVDFVEWETICVTLEDWEHIAERFEKSTHYAEKALCKILVNDIVPAVTQELKEIQRKRELEDALVHRKRSSRIALKESEREEARLAAKRQREEEERQSRTRRLEARLQKEEAERIKRENAREQRRKEREAREESRKASVTPEIKQGIHPNKKERPSPSGNVQSKVRKVNNGGPRTVANDDWELSCEICQRHGINLDDGTPMMSCGRCSKWQHILCHNRADQAAGRPPRNWDSVDFICKKCRTSWQDHYTDRVFSPSEQHSAMHASQLPAFRPYQPVTIPPTDRGYPYVPAFREPNQQSFYIRPHNGQPVSSGLQASPAPNNAPRSAISFSHYQPAAHNFSGHKSYPESQPHYSHPNPQFRSTSQPYKTQTIVPGWNNPAQLHAPGYPYSQNGYPVAPSPAVQRGLQGEHAVAEHTPQALHRYSATHYPPTQYLSTQFKHQSASYQPPLDRQ